MIELIIYFAALLCPDKNHIHTVNCIPTYLSVEVDTGGEIGNVPPGPPTPPTPPPPPPPNPRIGR